MSPSSSPPPATPEEAALDRILEGLLHIMRGNFDYELPVTSSHNVVDAIHAAINMTANELKHRDAERRATMQRLEHLNRVLRAIREVDQLIVSERRADELLKRACRLIVDSHSYERAWLITQAPGRTAPEHVAQAGWGESFAPMAEQLRSGSGCSCVERSRITEGVVTIHDPSSECQGCPLGGLYDGQLALVTRLAHADEVLGTLVVTASPALLAQDDDHELLAELASDLAYALRNIQIEQERAAAVEKLRRSHEVLRTTSAQLVQAAKLSAMGELAAGVAHELNQPLNVMLLIAQYRLRYGLAQSDDLREDFNEITRQVGAMSEVVDHMILFARPTAGLATKPLDLASIVRQALRLVTAQLSSHGIELETQLDEPLPPIQGNTTKLGQVVLNLISNAREALRVHEQPGHRVTVRTFVRPGANDAEDRVVLEISDNGCGMSTEVIDRIFEPFFTTKTVGHGPGLGLPVARAIVEDHHGSIHVQSEVGEGSVFQVELPATSRQSSPPRSTGDPSLSRFSPPDEVPET